MNKEFKEIDKNGFCVIPGILDMAIVDGMRNKIIKAFNEREEQINTPNKNVLFLGIEEVFDVIEIKKVDELCKMFCGPLYKIDHCFFIRGNSNANPGDDLIDIADFHGGILSDDGSNRYLAHCPKKFFARANRFNIGIPMTPIGPDYGGPTIIPGTHRASGYKDMWNYSPQEVARNRRKNIIIPSANPGDLFCFVDSAIHGTSKHCAERIFAYIVISPHFSQLVEYEASAKMYYDMATTKSQKSRSMKGFQKKILNGFMTDRKMIMPEKKWDELL